MNILHICGSFPPAYAYGGPPRSIHNLTSALVDRGHDVTVYTTDAKDAEGRVDRKDVLSLSDGVFVRRFRNVSNRLAWKNIQFPPAMLKALYKNVSDFDIVHSHEFRSPPTSFAHLIASHTGVPHVHQPRGSIPRYELQTIKSVFDSFLGKRIITQADRLIASSQTESQNYTSVFPHLNSEKIRRIPNGISLDHYRNLPPRGAFKKSQGISTDQRVILFLSRLHPRKGGDLLIDAVSRVATDDVSLVFVGPNEGAKDGWKRLAATNQIADQVHFVGPLYNDEKLEAYVDADVFVLPSKNDYESFGNVVIEAMACGTPAIMTNVCGVSEWISHDSCLSTEPTPEALSNAIKALLAESVDSSTLKKHVQDNFGWNAVAKHTEAVYQEVIS